MSRYQIDYSQWDESVVRDRPSKHGSRPRTKQRPTHDDAVPARVIAVDRGRYTVVPTQDPDTTGKKKKKKKPSGQSPLLRQVTAMRARELRRTSIVVGDLVWVVGDLSGDDGTLARIVKLGERESVLRRSADDSDAYERVVVANVDILVIVVAAAQPEPRTGFIDRALVAAFHAGITPVLCITKTDLRDPSSLIENYADVDLEILTSQATNALEPGEEPDEGYQEELDTGLLEALRKRLSGHISALVGPSGVGKSTLLNALTGADRETGHINAVTGRGRHTSSSAVAVPLETEEDQTAGREVSWLIDTPGIRSFGLGLVEPDDVVSAFEELVPAIAECPRGCLHTEDSPGCALDAWVNDGQAGPAGPQRLESLRRLLENRNSAQGSRS